MAKTSFNYKNANFNANCAEKEAKKVLSKLEEILTPDKNSIMHDLQFNPFLNNNYEIEKDNDKYLLKNDNETLAIISSDGRGYNILNMEYNLKKKLASLKIENYSSGINIKPFEFLEKLDQDLNNSITDMIMNSDRPEFNLNSEKNDREKTISLTINAELVEYDGWRRKPHLELNDFLIKYRSRLFIDSEEYVMDGNVNYGRSRIRLKKVTIKPGHCIEDQIKLLGEELKDEKYMPEGLAPFLKINNAELVCDSIRWIIESGSIMINDKITLGKGGIKRIPDVIDSFDKCNSSLVTRALDNGYKIILAGEITKDIAVIGETINVGKRDPKDVFKERVKLTYKGSAKIKVPDQNKPNSLKAASSSMSLGSIDDIEFLLEGLVMAEQELGFRNLTAKNIYDKWNQEITGIIGNEGIKNVKVITNDFENITCKYEFDSPMGETIRKTEKF